MRPYRTTIDEVPLEHGLREDEGWIDMQVQFLIDARAHGLTGVTARVLRDGEEVATTDDLTALTGSLEFVLETVALHAERKLHDGELVIAGSVVPPQPIAPGEHWRMELLPLGTLEVGPAG